MKYLQKVPRSILKKFDLDYSDSGFEGAASSLVTVQGAVALFGVLQPTFVKYQNCIFLQNELGVVPKTPSEMIGFRYDENGKGTLSSDPVDIEKYKNNISCDEIISIGIDEIEKRRSLSKEKLDNLTDVSYVFMEQIARYWYFELKLQFPEREFEFDIGPDRLGELGICMTFWQPR